MKQKKRAKSLSGKDAFAIRLMKRSGEERVTIAKWRYGDKDTIELLNDLKEKLNESRREIEGY
ncbi:hypothetical protein H5T89_03715, partial [bacterium]|nr:hypothetical protein [bacterium]